MGDMIIPVKFTEYDGIEPIIEIETDNNSMIDKLYIDKPHNGRPITKLEVSPNGKYLVTYSEKDHSIVRWNISIDDSQYHDEISKEYPDEVQRVDEGQLKPDITFKMYEYIEISKICVFDDKKLAYIYIDDKLKGNNEMSSYPAVPTKLLSRDYSKKYFCHPSTFHIY